MTAEVIQMDHAVRLERDRRIFRMCLEGESLAEITEKEKCSLAEVYAAQHRMASGVTPEFIARVLELDLARLNELHKVYYKLALGEGDKPPDKEAATLCLRFIERRAKFLGLDQLPRGSTPEGDKREPSDHEQIKQAILRMARGPLIEGEAVEISDKNDG